MHQSNKYLLICSLEGRTPADNVELKTAAPALGGFFFTPTSA